MHSPSPHDRNATFKAQVISSLMSLLALVPLPPCLPFPKCPEIRVVSNSHGFQSKTFEDFEATGFRSSISIFSHPRNPRHLTLHVQMRQVGCNTLCRNHGQRQVLPVLQPEIWRKKQTTCPTSPEVWGCNIHAKLGNLGISTVESSLEQSLALWMIEIGTFGSIAISMLKGWPMPPAPPTTQTCKMCRNVSLFEIRGHTWPDLPKRNLARFPKGPKAKCNRTLYFPITMSTGCDNTIVERTAAHSTCRSSQIRPWSFLPWLHTEKDECVSKWLQVLADVMQKPWHATCYIRLLLDSQSIIYSSCFIWIYFMYVSSVPYI